MTKCPFCAEEIQSEAIKCKHCGEWLRVEGQTAVRHALPAYGKAEVLTQNNSRYTQRTLTGPLVGASLMILSLAVAWWAWNSAKAQRWSYVVVDGEQYRNDAWTGKVDVYISGWGWLNMEEELSKWRAKKASGQVSGDSPIIDGPAGGMIIRRHFAPAPGQPTPTLKQIAEGMDIKVGETGVFRAEENKP